VDEVKQECGAGSAATLRAGHTQGYRPPPVRRTYISKPGKREQRPLGVPCVGDRVLTHSVADVLSAIYEPDLLPGSFGGRPGVGDPRILRLIRRWLTAGVLEDGAVEPSAAGGPQGGSISGVLRNRYLHDVLDLWCERIMQPRLPGAAYLIRYMDDCVVCCQHRADAERFQQVWARRRAKCA
jgi:RNA-directed DNA polymerase